MKNKYGNSVNVHLNDGLALVCFDRGVNRNALDQDTILALTAVARDLTDALDIKTVVLTGTDTVFSAGIDLKDPAKWEDEGASLLLRRNIAQRGARLCRQWEELPQLTIAAMEGPTVGGAVALALACDLRVAATNAFIYLPEAKVGLNMGWGAIPRMVSLIGPAKTKRAILMDEKLPSATALDWGLIDKISEPGAAAKAAQDLALHIGQTPSAIIRMTKEAVNACATALHKVGIYMDADQALVCRDSIEGRQARQDFLTR